MKHVYQYRTLLAGVVLAALMFSPAPAAAQAVLGTAANFAVLAASTITNTGPTTIIGSVGLSPGTSITGMPGGQPTGGTIHVADGVAAQAQLDLTAAYIALSGTACTTDMSGVDLGGLTLVAGVYCYTSSAQLTGTLTLNGQGNPNSVFIFKIASTLTTASSASVIVTNGAQACNVYWLIGSSATLGVNVGTSSHITGNILALTSISLATGAILDGRALARTGAVTLDSNRINMGQCLGPTAASRSTWGTVKAMYR